MTAQPTRRQENSEATRAALLEAARAAFASAGYQASGIEEVSRAARVTRGAFYHHFEDKRALFDAVVVLLQERAAARIREAALREGGVRERLLVGIGVYLDVCTEPDYARVVLYEAPAVLGAARARAIEEAHPTALLAATLGSLGKRGEIEVGDVALLTRLLDALVCRLALVLAAADDPDATRAEGMRIIEGLLAGLRPRGRRRD